MARSCPISRLARRASPRCGEVGLDPAADDVDGVGLLGRAELAPLRDVVPALEAAAAAGRARVLGDEHRVAAVRRLLAVLVWRGGCKASGQQLTGVPANDVHAAQLDGRRVPPAQVE